MLGRRFEVANRNWGLLLTEMSCEEFRLDTCWSVTSLKFGIFTHCCIAQSVLHPNVLHTLLWTKFNTPRQNSIVYFISYCIFILSSIYIDTLLQIFIGRCVLCGKNFFLFQWSIFICVWASFRLPNHFLMYNILVNKEERG